MEASAPKLHVSFHEIKAGKKQGSKSVFGGQAEETAIMAGLQLELNSERYVELLRKLIGETKYLQNNPPRFIPQEDRYIIVVVHTRCTSMRIDGDN